MHKPINCVQVNATDANERNRMETFAQSFDHEIGTWRYPIFEAKKDDYTIGYAQVVNTPVVFTAWNPKACKPRDIYDACNWWRAWSLTQYGHGMTTVPTNKDTKFTSSIMENLGFKRMNLELYEI